MSMHRGYIKGFDGLRAISILLVLLAHLSVFVNLPPDIKRFTWPLVIGTTGVYMFFTLSGFLITGLLLTEKAEKGRIAFRKFMARRFLRLAPPLICFLLVVGLLMSFNMIHTTRVGFLYSFFYLYNFVPAQYYTTVLGHTWSLGVEEQFYMVWPLVVKFLNKAAVFVTAIGLIAISFVAFDFLLGNKALADGYFIQRWFFPAIGPIIIGAVFGLLNFQYHEKVSAFFVNRKALALALGVILFLGSMAIPDSRLNLMFIVHSTGISMILLWILHNQGSGLVRLLEIRPLAFIGKISYGLYVWQGLFLTTGAGSGKLTVQQFPLNIILTFAVSIISYYFIEKRILRYKELLR